MDHLLSMEKIEKKNRVKSSGFSARAKRFQKKEATIFLLGFERIISQILFFEN